MAIYTDMVEAQLSPGVTFRAPHGRKVLAWLPGEGMTPRGSPCATVWSPWPQGVAIRSTAKATNGLGFTCGPLPHNRLPMSLVKVLLCRTTMADALSNGTALNRLKRVKGLYPTAKARGI
jgi:hypothetical protein